MENSQDRRSWNRAPAVAWLVGLVYPKKPQVRVWGGNDQIHVFLSAFKVLH